ncbi:hypothetical protein [Chiayiivirga flava]|uniref:Secreted protein n=1 Tax=Chiayiivirga flava TaxID=659595 RepID=A0A7W8G214_9GAMM|nr:hypothetical protein [Chiayiivirga flava]MBB5209468.1 hypothetical protein [Chiayiivirga flava]
MSALAHRLVLAFAALLLAACAGARDDAAPAPETPAPAAPIAKAAPARDAAVGSVDFSCTADADCTIKDVGNCCGAYPACVNVESPTFPDQVKAQCEAEGLSSVCGYPSINRCQCIEGRCEGVSGVSVAPAARTD